MTQTSDHLHVIDHLQGVPCSPAKGRALNVNCNTVKWIPTMMWGQRRTLAIQGTTSHFAPQRTRRVFLAWPHHHLTPVSASQHASRAAFVDEISVCVADTRVASPRGAQLCMNTAEACAVTEGNHCMFVGALPVSISSRLLSALRDILAETWSYT